MQSVPREWLDFLRQQFPKDSRIQLTEIGGNPRPISPDSTGKLDYIDDAGQFHVKWDNGCTLALVLGEDRFSVYPPYNEVQARELIDCLREIAPYVVIDCGSYIANDILSAVALMEADSVLRLANADLKSISYLSSQLPLLRDAKWDTDKQYKTASNVKSQQAGDHMSQALGTVAFTLPHSAELEGQYLAGNLLADLSMKDSRVFRKEIEKIAREVFGC